MEARTAATVRSLDARKPSRGGTLDGRSPTAKKRQATIADLVAALGGQERITAVQMSAITRAAELAVLAAETRAKALSGDTTVDMAALVRLEGAAGRAARALNLPVQSGGPKPQSLSDYLAAKAARKAASDPGDTG